MTVPGKTAKLRGTRVERVKGIEPSGNPLQIGPEFRRQTHGLRAFYGCFSVCSLRPDFCPILGKSVRNCQELSLSRFSLLHVRSPIGISEQGRLPCHSGPSLDGLSKHESSGRSNVRHSNRRLNPSAPGSKGVLKPSDQSTEQRCRWRKPLDSKGLRSADVGQHPRLARRSSIPGECPTEAGQRSQST
jgi:hypothetical protein